MNQGLFGFPQRDGQLISVNDFTSSGTYSVPSGASVIRIMAIGGGGGGGGGRRGAVGTVAGSGGGGSSGAMQLIDFHVSELASVSALQIIIGSGGTGGPAAAADSTNGTIGADGGATEIRHLGYPNRFIFAAGGVGGGAGTTAGGLGGLAYSCNVHKCSSTGGSGTAGRTTSFGLTVSPQSNSGLCGGAGGGGVDATNAGWAGNNVNSKTASGSISGVLNPSLVFNTAVATGGAVNSAAGPTPTPQEATDNPSRFGPGFGGAGGGAGTTQAATNGGSGVRGGGGGGGGGSRNGFAAGAGGRGGDGYVCIWVWG